MSETTVNVAGVPLNAGVGSSVRLVAPVKLYPVMVTAVPSVPRVGEKPVILGFTMRVAELAALPIALATVIGPVAAPTGTMALSCVSESPSK